MSTAIQQESTLDMHNLPMGCHLHENACTFKVWAPHADKVSVIGSFNEWKAEQHTLFGQDGFWFGEFEGIKAGDEYLYEIINGDQTLKKIDPHSRLVTNSVGNSVVYADTFEWEDDNYTLPPHNEVVIYELHLGSFTMKDDGTPGTFDDLIEKLDYFKDLGINVIQIMPVAEFAGDLSWGYNPAHPFAVETAYGGPDAFKRLVKAAHQKGIGIVLDVVFNHFGPSDLNLWRFDGWSENDKGGIYFFNDDRASTPWGDTRPDYGRTEVRDYILDNVRMWLQEYRVDGLRLDMTVFMRTKNGNITDASDAIPEGWALCQSINSLARELKENVLMISEDLQGEAGVTLPVEQGGAGFSTQWDKHFVHPVRAVLLEQDDSHRDMHAIESALRHTYNGADMARVIYTESHDEVANGSQRVPSAIGDAGDHYFSLKRSTLGASLVMLSPGIPMIFQGQEFAQEGWFKDDEALAWHKVEKLAGIHQLYSDLIVLRRNSNGTSKALQGHQLEILANDTEQKIIAFTRHWPNENAMLIIANFSNIAVENYSLPLGQCNIELVFNSDASAYHPHFDDVGEISAHEDDCTFTIGAYSVMVAALR